MLITPERRLGFQFARPPFFCKFLRGGLRPQRHGSPDTDGTRADGGHSCPESYVQYSAGGTYHAGHVLQAGQPAQERSPHAEHKRWDHTAGCPRGTGHEF